MPIYEYACVTCGAKLEVFQKVNDAPLTDCRACDQPTLQKCVSASGFRLEGSGWYATGYEKDFKKETGKKSQADVNVSATSTAPANNTADTSTKTEASA